MDMSKLHRVLFITLLVALGVIARLISSTGALFGGAMYFDTFAVLALISLVAGYCGNRPLVVLVPIAVMLVSDPLLYVLGVTSTFGTPVLLWLAFFVWTGFGAISLLGVGVSRMGRGAPLVWFLGGSIWSVLLFDTWTNFGFYLAFYPHSISGLVACALAAIPFTLGHLISVLFLSPVAYGLAYWGKNHVLWS